LTSVIFIRLRGDASRGGAAAQAAGAAAEPIKPAAGRPTKKFLRFMELSRLFVNDGQDGWTAESGD
jgi:hypothetical protein